MREDADHNRIHLVYSSDRNGRLRMDELREAVNRLAGAERILLLRMLDAQKRQTSAGKPALFAVSN